MLHAIPRSCDRHFFLMIPPPPRSILFPYTTLFRSGAVWQLHDLDAPGDSDLYWQAAAGGYGKSCCSRSEELTSELQSLRHLVCRLLLEKKDNPPVMAKYINGKKNLQDITGTRGHLD